MKNTKDSQYSILISERIRLLMDIAGLEIAGFSEFTKVSESHIYSILNQTRDLTGEVADKFAEGFRLKGWQLLKLDYKIPKSIRKAPLLIQFYKEHQNISEYFLSTKDERKSSRFIEFELLNTSLFDKPVYLREIREACSKMNRNYTSDELSKILTYLVSKGKLKSQKKPIKLKSGDYGTRLVDVFLKNKSKPK